MKLPHKIIYGIVLILVIARAVGATVNQYEYLDSRYWFGYDYDSKINFYLERLQEGMFVEPILLFLMVAGLIIRKYSGWILTLLLPFLILLYTIGNLLGLVDFWGITPVVPFIIYYVLLIILNISKVRKQIFSVNSTQKALQGNLLTISMSMALILELTLVN